MPRTDEVRPFRSGDEEAITELLQSSLGSGPLGTRSLDLFRWKHIDNPFGGSFMLVAEDAGRLVGLRAFMRWRFLLGDRTVEAVRAVDTAVHPDFQGRGLFTRLTLAALDLLPKEIELVFNTPNEKSLPGYLKMGWKSVGTIPMTIRARRPIALAARSGHKGAITELDSRPSGSGLPSDDAMERLLETTPGFPDRLCTARDPAYLRWRYESLPDFGYRVTHGAPDDRWSGMAVFRIRERRGRMETTVCEFMAPGRRAPRRLLKSLSKVANSDYVAVHLPSRSDRLHALRHGFVTLRRGPLLVVRPLHRDIGLDVTQLQNWAFSFGDLEVF